MTWVRTAKTGRRRLSGLAWIAVAGVLLSGSAVHAATVTVLVDGVLPAPGRVYVSLCSGGLEPASCGTGLVEPASASRLRFTFQDVEPGIYAVAAFQDLNGNGTLDRSRNGLPLEPYAFSNAAGRTGAPRFERAALRITGSVEVDLRLVSLLASRP